MTILARARRFLSKRPADQVRAAGATLRHALHPPKAPDPDAAFRRLVLANLENTRLRLQALVAIEGERYRRELVSAPIYADRRRLPPYGLKIYSQNDEGGIVQEIFARIGTQSRTFVEFGAGNGLENNTLKLLLEGWSGLWIEGAAEHVADMHRKFHDVIGDGRLVVRHALIDRDNLNPLIGAVFSGEIDLLSVDVDGNDIHLFEALHAVNPRVAVIEYNAKFPPPLSIAQAYNPAHRWTGSDYMGASLAALAKVAERKGHALAGCSMVGANAFFVRQDLLQDKFCPPYTAENHYQPARYVLTRTFHAGHTPDWGPYVSV
jgi:hypothetical protein